MRRLAGLALLLALAIVPAAQAACPQTSVTDVENEVMCPVCGTPLSVAEEAPQAQRERELIRRLVDRCRSKEQIKDVLVAEYGDRVLAVPDDDGFDLASYLVPALALLVGAGAVTFAALRWRERRDREGPADAAPAAAANARLESDLERYEL